MQEQQDSSASTRSDEHRAWPVPHSQPILHDIDPRVHTPIGVHTAIDAGFT